MKVSGTNLTMTRGDSESLTVKIKDRPFVEGDIVEMTVRKRCSSPEIELHKKVTSFLNGVAIIDIDPEDTHKSDFGKYVYDIQWTNSDGKVKTIVEPTKGNFTLTEEATY